MSYPSKPASDVRIVFSFAIIGALLLSALLAANDAPFSLAWSGKSLTASLLLLFAGLLPLLSLILVVRVPSKTQNRRIFALPPFAENLLQRLRPLPAPAAQQEDLLLRWGANRRQLLRKKLLKQLLLLFVVAYGLSFLLIAQTYESTNSGGDLNAMQLATRLSRELQVMLPLAVIWPLFILGVFSSARAWLGRWAPVLLFFLLAFIPQHLPALLSSSSSLGEQASLSFRALGASPLSPLFHLHYLLGAFDGLMMPFPAWLSLLLLALGGSLGLYLTILRSPR